MMPRAKPIAAILTLLLAGGAARALIITGGDASAPITDHNFPQNSLDLANLPSRIGWWEGPPFGGGQFQFIYRGDTAALQIALDAFANIRAPELRLILHEGPQNFSILRAGRRDRLAPGPGDVDESGHWTFTVWDPRSWHNLYNNPKTIAMAGNGNAFRNPIDPPIFDVYLDPNSKNLDWSAIKLPKNPRLTIIDERAASHGYAAADRSVLVLDLYDLTTSKPIANATIALEKLTVNVWESITTAPTDANGHVELKKIPPGNYRLTASANNFATRAITHAEFKKATFKTITTTLAPAVTVKGTVRDTDGKPLPNVTLRVDSTLGQDGRAYLLTDSPKTTTDAQGNFQLAGVPQGYLHIRTTADQYYGLEPFRIIDALGTSGPNLVLQMTPTGSVKGKVLNPDGTPATSGNVDLTPDGDPIGKWGGSMNIRPDGTYEFTGVPPGHYTLSTNPGARFTPTPDPSAKGVDIKPRESAEVTLIKVAPQRPAARPVPRVELP